MGRAKRGAIKSRAARLLRLEGTKVPICHFTPMKYETGDSNDLGDFEEWFICNHCGCVKDLSGNVVPQN